MTTKITHRRAHHVQIAGTASQDASRAAHPVERNPFAGGPGPTHVTDALARKRKEGGVLNHGHLRIDHNRGV